MTKMTQSDLENVVAKAVEILKNVPSEQIDEVMKSLQVRLEPKLVIKSAADDIGRRMESVTKSMRVISPQRTNNPLPKPTTKP